MQSQSILQQIVSEFLNNIGLFKNRQVGMYLLFLNDSKINGGLEWQQV